MLGARLRAKVFPTVRFERSEGEGRMWRLESPPLPFGYFGREGERRENVIVPICHPRTSKNHIGAVDKEKGSRTLRFPSPLKSYE